MEDTKNFKKNIGSRIRRARERLNLSQEALGQKIGKTSKAISAYETGKRLMPLEDLPKLAEALEISILYFFSDAYGAHNSHEYKIGVLFSVMHPRFRDYSVQLIETISRVNQDLDSKIHKIEGMTEAEFTNLLSETAVSMYLGGLTLLTDRFEKMEKLFELVLGPKIQESQGD